MGLFDSNSARTTNTTDIDQDFSDRKFADNNSGNIGGNINISANGSLEGVVLEQTDFGAVEGSLSVAESAVESFRDFGNEVLNRQSVSNQSNLSTLKDFATTLKTNGNDQTQKIVQNIIFAVVAIGGVALIVSKVKK